MKIAAVSMVRNESDIIELFFRINSRVFDHFFILDNGSNDTTPQIIDLLIKEGLPITVSRDAALGYPQDKLTTALLKQAAATGYFDWIFPIDTDEFVLTERHILHEALSRIEEAHCAQLKWTTFVPIATNYFDVVNPLWTNFRARRVESTERYKVIVPAVLAHRGRVTMGNHAWKGQNGKRERTSIIDIPLAHAPIRSNDQLICKALIGSHQFSIKPNRRGREGFHWDILASQIRQSHYILTQEQLIAMAFNYGAHDLQEAGGELREDLHIGEKTDQICYGELAKINNLQRLDDFVTATCAEINKLRGQNSWLSRLFKQ